MKISPILAAARKTIHAACRQLEMDEDTRRATIELVAGVRSTTQLDLAACKKVMEHLKTKGWKHTGQRANQAHKPLAASKASIERKIGWQLGQLGKGWDYVYGKLQSNVAPGIECFEMLTVEQLSDISSALAKTIRSKNSRQQSALSQSAISKTGSAES